MPDIRKLILELLKAELEQRQFTISHLTHGNYIHYLCCSDGLLQVSIYVRQDHCKCYVHSLVTQDYYKATEVRFEDPKLVQKTVGAVDNIKSWNRHQLPQR